MDMYEARCYTLEFWLEKIRGIEPNAKVKLR